MNKPTYEFPKVLVCAPQHDSKDYAFERWFNRVQDLTYSNFEVFLADNSKTEEYANKLRSVGITVQWIPQHENGLIYTMADAHNACRQYAIDNDFDYMLHLETDIIPPMDVIERLMKHRKGVCAGVYDIFYGSQRRLMIQIAEGFDRTIGAFRSPDFVTDTETLFFDGQLKKVFHAGLGCVLIKRKVFEEIEFRAEPGNDYHPDTWFANDCFKRKIPIFADPNIICEHHNQTWLSKIDELQPTVNA